jgi:hypothetical protein
MTLRSIAGLGLLGIAGAAVLLASELQSQPRAEPGARLAQRANPAPVPGGLPGVAPLPLPAPAPQQAPSLPSPAAPVQVVPPPSPPRLNLPDAGGTAACDCHVDVEVPIYEQGRLVRSQRERRVVGRGPQCCPK